MQRNTAQFVPYRYRCKLYTLSRTTRVPDFGYRKQQRIHFADDSDEDAAAFAASSSSFLSFRCIFLRFCRHGSNEGEH